MESCRSGLADTRFRIPAATPFPAMERGKNCFPMGEFSHGMTAADLNVFQHVQRFPEFVRGSGACQPREFVGQQDKIPVSGEHQALPADFHHGDVGMGCQDFDFVGVQQVAHRFRRGAEAVFPGAEQIVRFLKGSDGGQILVGGDAQGRVIDVFPGKEGSQIVLAGFCGELRFAVDDEVRS